MYRWFFMLYAVSDKLISYRFSLGVYLDFYGNQYFLEVVNLRAPSTHGTKL
jgi:hypothetical protein